MSTAMLNGKHLNTHMSSSIGKKEIISTHLNSNMYLLDMVDGHFHIVSHRNTVDRCIRNQRRYSYKHHCFHMVAKYHTVDWKHCNRHPSMSNSNRRMEKMQILVELGNKSNIITFDVGLLDCTYHKN